MRRFLLLLGLIAIAGLTYFTVFSGGSASAIGGTTLCKTAENPCAAANHYPTGTMLQQYSISAEILTTFGNVVCEKSGFGVSSKTTTTGSSSTSVEATINEFFFSGCRIQTPSADDSCTVTVLNAPYTGVIANLGSTKGSLTVSSGGKGNLTAKVDCGAKLLKCEFAFGTPVLDVSSGTPWSYFANRESLTGTVYEGGICPKEASWYGLYNLAGTPSTMYIESSA